MANITVNSPFALDIQNAFINDEFVRLNDELTYLDTQTVFIFDGADNYFVGSWGRWSVSGTGSGFTGNVPILNSISMESGGDFFKLAGSINLATGGGSLSSMSIRLDDFQMAVVGSIRINANLDFIGGSIKSIAITDADESLTINGTITLNTMGDLAGGTINSFSYEDSSGNKFAASGIAMNTATFLALTENHTDLSDLFQALNLNSNDIIISGASNDQLNGGGGRDVLSGNGGVDTLDGGIGGDIYLMSRATDHQAAEVQDTGVSGMDEVRFVAEDTLGGSTLTLYAGDTGIEKVVIGTGSGVDAATSGTLGLNINASAVLNTLTIIGNAGANSLTGTAYGDTIYGGNGDDILNGGNGDDILNGGIGEDDLSGNDGDDSYLVDNPGDTVTELDGEGIDTVMVSMSGYQLGAHLEHLTLIGGAQLGIGNDKDNFIQARGGVNTLNGLEGNDTLDGGAGADHLNGGTGDDTYIVDNAGDRITELDAEGTDTVLSSVTYSLADTDGVGVNGGHVEGLTLTGKAHINATGNTLDNTLIGNSGSNVLNGAEGNDTLDGLEGNDIYLVSRATDHQSAEVQDSGVSGIDEVRFAAEDTLDGSTLTLYAGDTGIEKVVIGTGTSAAAVMSGTQALNIDASDVLDGLTIVGNAGANQLTGTAFDDQLIGGNGDDTLVGGLGNDTLDGGKGMDSMTGGEGDDTYLINKIGDTVTEFDGEGIDTVISSISHYQLGAHEEHLMLLSGAQLGIGNDKDNFIQARGGVNTLNGLEGNDTLDGGAGADHLNGGTGDDTYIVDNAGDRITELDAEGTDTVLSSVTYSLADTDGVGVNGGHVEGLTLTGKAHINATGNTLDNTLIGNNGSNVLTGGLGADDLWGGLGKDVFDFNSVLDSLNGSGSDRIMDFAVGDRIDLAGIDADISLDGEQAFNYIGSGDFSAAGQLRFSGNVLSGDVDGDLVADFEILVVGVSELVLNDLIL